MIGGSMLPPEVAALTTEQRIIALRLAAQIAGWMGDEMAADLIDELADNLTVSNGIALEVDRAT